MLEFKFPRQNLHMLYRKFIRWKQVKFFILFENLLLCEIRFQIVNRLKSFGFKSLFVYFYTPVADTGRQFGATASANACGPLNGAPLP